MTSVTDAILANEELNRQSSAAQDAQQKELARLERNMIGWKSPFANDPAWRREETSPLVRAIYRNEEVLQRSVSMSSMSPSTRQPLPRSGQPGQAIAASNRVSGGDLLTRSAPATFTPAMLTTAKCTCGGAGVYSWKGSHFCARCAPWRTK